MKQEIMGWQWHQLDHVEIICTLLQTDNHASTSSLNSYKPDALRDAQPTLSRLLHMHNFPAHHSSVLTLPENIREMPCVIPHMSEYAALTGW